jgi:hypothetical protein
MKSDDRPMAVSAILNLPLSMEFSVEMKSDYQQPDQGNLHLGANCQTQR